MPSFVMTWPRRRGVRLSPLLFALPCVNVAGGGSGDRVVDVAGIDGAGGGCRRRVVRRRGGGAGGLSTCCRRGGYRQGERRVVRRRGEWRVVCRPVVDVGGIIDEAGGDAGGDGGGRRRGRWRLVVTWRGPTPAAARSSTWQALTGRAAAVDRVVDGLALVGRLSTGWGVVVVVGRRDGCVILLGHSQQFCQL